MSSNQEPEVPGTVAPATTVSAAKDFLATGQGKEVLRHAYHKENSANRERKKEELRQLARSHMSGGGSMGTLPPLKGAKAPVLNGSEAGEPPVTPGTTRRRRRKKKSNKAPDPASQSQQSTIDSFFSDLASHFDSNVVHKENHRKVMPMPEEPPSPQRTRTHQQDIKGVGLDADPDLDTSAEAAARETGSLKKLAVAPEEPVMFTKRPPGSPSKVGGVSVAPTIADLFARAEFSETSFISNMKLIKNWPKIKIKANEFPKMLEELWCTLDKDNSTTLCKAELKGSVRFAFFNENLLHKNKLDKKFQLFQLSIVMNHFEAACEADPSIITCSAFEFDNRMIIRNAIMNVTDEIWSRGALPSSGHTNAERFQNALFDLDIADANMECHGKKYLLAPKALNCIDIDNDVRRLIARTTTHKVFETLILGAILSNSAVLAMVDYQDLGAMRGNPNWGNMVVEKSELWFTTIFTCEAIMKIIALGLYDFPTAYLQDYWNCMDFIVVLAGLLAILPGVPTVSSLRTIRVLRPLRTLSSLPGMRKLISALIEALPGLFNVLILLLFVFIILGIMGLQLWEGKLHWMCRSTQFPNNITGEWPVSEFEARTCVEKAGVGEICPVGEWCGNMREPPAGYEAAAKLWLSSNIYGGDFNFGFTNFDSIWRASLTIFQCVTMEGWTPIMYMVQDAGGRYTFIYFFIIVIVCSFFLLNMVLAVISEAVEAFKEVEADAALMEKAALLDRPGSPGPGAHLKAQTPHASVLAQQISGKAFGATTRGLLQVTATGEATKIVAKTKATPKKKKKYFIKPVYRIILHPVFDGFIMCVIIVNTVVLSLDGYPPNPGQVKILEDLSFALTLIFIFEMVMKMLGLGVRKYLQDSFNTFDCFIVGVSIVEMVMNAYSIAGSSGAITQLRAFRLLRIFKLAKSWKPLRDLLSTASATIMESGNFLLLLVLFIYIFSLLGMELFSTKFKFDFDTQKRVDWEPLKYTDGHPMWSKERPYDTPRTNFDDITNAFLAVFQCLSGEDWNAVLYDGIRSAGWIAVLYFFMLIIVGNFIVLNLFLAILLGNGPEDDEEEESVRMAELLEEGKIAPDSSDDEEEKDAERRDKEIARVKSKARRASTADSAAIAQCSDASDSSGTDNDDSEADAESDGEDAVQEVACCFFGTKNIIRRACMWLLTKPAFENFIIVCIIVSSISLAMDSPLEDPSSQHLIVLHVLNEVLTVTFVFECLVRVMALSFVGYIRDGWNVLDFMIVLISLSTYVVTAPQTLSSFRALRALRPLRVIRRNPGMKKVVDTMLKTVPPASNVMMVCGVFFLIFGIMGVTFFKGTYYSCDIEGFNSTVQDMIESDYGLYKETFKKHFMKSDCLQLGGEWSNAQQTFDHVGMAMINLLEIATTEGWVDAMYNGVDATGIDMQPVRGWNRGYAAFFVAFVVVGNFFVLNLFVGAVIDAFNQLNDGSGGSTLAMTQGQLEWVEHHKVAVKLYTSMKHANSQATKDRDRMHALAVSDGLSNFIMGCIVLNTCSMASNSYQQDERWDQARQYIDWTFALIFTLEAGIKIWGLRFKYFVEGWNIFDFVIVVGSNATIVIEQVLQRKVGALAQAARAFRMCRMARLVKGMAAFEAMLDLLIRNLPMMTNISAVLLLLLFVYAVMAMQVFGQVITPQDYLTRHANFQNFLNSYLTLFRCTTGEAWNGVMYDLLVQEGCVENPTYEQLMEAREEAQKPWITIGCGVGRPLVTVFFMSFVVIASFVMLNLFVAVLVEAFTQEKNHESSNLRLKEHNEFCEAWLKFDPDLSYKCRSEMLPVIVNQLYAPLGTRGAKKSRRQIHRLCSSLEIPDSQGELKCIDVYKGLVRRFHKIYGKESADKQDEDAKLEERKRLAAADKFVWKYTVELRKIQGQIGLELITLGDMVHLRYIAEEEHETNIEQEISENHRRLSMTLGQRAKFHYSNSKEEVKAKLVEMAKEQEAAKEQTLAGGKLVLQSDPQGTRLPVKHRGVAKRGAIKSINILPDQSTIPKEIVDKLRAGDVILRVDGNVVTTCAAAVQAIEDAITSHVKLHMGRRPPTERRKLTWGERNALVLLQRIIRLRRMQALGLHVLKKKGGWADQNLQRPEKPSPSKGKVHRVSTAGRNGRRLTVSMEGPDQPTQVLREVQTTHGTDPRKASLRVPASQSPSHDHTRNSHHNQHDSRNHDLRASESGDKSPSKARRSSVTSNHQQQESVIEMMDRILGTVAEEKHDEATHGQLARAKELQLNQTALRSFREEVVEKELAKQQAAGADDYVQAQQFKAEIGLLKKAFVDEFNKGRQSLNAMQIGNMREQVDREIADRLADREEEIFMEPAPTKDSDKEPVPQLQYRMGELARRQQLLTTAPVAPLQSSQQLPH
jgi:hypothetical protein